MLKKIPWLLACTLVFGWFGFFSSRADAISQLPSSKQMEDLYNQAAGLYNVEDYYDVNAIEEQMKQQAPAEPETPAQEGTLYLYPDELTLYPLFSEFVDAIWLENGVYTNVSPIAQWESSNSEILSAHMGRLKANTLGDVTVTVSYRGKTKQLQVHVVGSPPALPKLRRRSLSFAASSAISAARQQALNNALAMINYEWSLQNDLIIWQNVRNKVLEPIRTYPKGKTVTGIIYTQSPTQTNLAQFQSALTKPDFFTVHYEIEYTTGKQRAMPQYGNDCSGFVSFAWGLNRYTTSTFLKAIRNGIFKKVGNYNLDAPSRQDLLNSYALMKPGDALIKPGHVMLVASVNMQRQVVTVYEQTPDYAQISYVAFDKLISSDPSRSYRPFILEGSSPLIPMQGYWQKEGGQWYFYNASNQRQTGWQQVKRKWYYLGSDGAMCTGWQYIGNVYYYFHSNGAMAAGEWVRNPKSGLWYYLQADGSMASSKWVQVGSTYYYFHRSGRMAASEWKQERDGGWYYLASDGAMVKSKKLKLGGKTYRFDQNGRCINP